MKNVTLFVICPGRSHKVKKIETVLTQPHTTHLSYTGLLMKSGIIGSFLLYWFQKHRVEWYIFLLLYWFFLTWLLVLQKNNFLYFYKFLQEYGLDFCEECVGYYSWAMFVSKTCHLSPKLLRVMVVISTQKRSNISAAILLFV